MTTISASDWEAYISRHPDAHILQSRAWGDLKSSFGWEVARFLTDEAIGAQVLFRRLPLGFCVAYIPRGPVVQDDQPIGSALLASEFWGDIDAECRKRRAVLLKLEPDIWEEEKRGDQPGLPPDFRLSEDSIQPPRTLVLNLEAEEDDILARMKQKTRYNIRLASRKGVRVHTSSDYDLFSQMMQVTGQRNEFGVHSKGYYRRAYELFSPRDQCQMFVAEYDGEPLGAIMVFARGPRAFYFYGASTNQHRERMPTYLLQWEAIKWARQKGCREYDLWGVPDLSQEDLEENFTQRSDGLWGVYRFKRGFGGELRRVVGPYDRVYNPFLYTVYRWWMRWRSGNEL